jgi:DNA polymerase-3 subunit epsilon
MLFSQPCVIVDLETTGGHIALDRITEVGIILIDGETIERFSTLVNPGRPIPPFIENMTGITNEMVADAPAFASLAADLASRLKGRLLVAHNARFDYGVLKNEFKRAGIRYRSETLCTVKLSRRLYPQHYKHNLDAIIARHQIDLPARHRALADAEGVYRFLLSASKELGDSTVWESAQALMAQSAAPAGMDQETFEALPDVAGVFWVFDTAGLPLYVGRGTNIRRQVLAHFTGGNHREIQLGGQAGKIEWSETVGEFGAALLEIVLMKKLHPRLNPKGRMASEACTVCLVAHDDGFLRPETIPAEQTESCGTLGHFGLFRTPRDARKALQELAQASSLCQSILGIERVTSRKGRPCDSRMTGRCRGACIGRESAAEHNERLRAALARLDMKDWPFASAAGIVEKDEVSGAEVEHVFDRWRYLGARPVGQQAMPDQTPMLDLDIYKLLNGYFRKPVQGTHLRQL